MGELDTPQPGEVWVKPSFPTPTVVTVLVVDGDLVCVATRKAGRARKHTLPLRDFLAQGFARDDTP